MKLLEEALKLRESPRPVSNDDLCLRAECELAIAYYQGLVYGCDAAKVVGKTSAQFGSWAAGKIMMGVRAKVIELRLVPIPEVPFPVPQAPSPESK